LLKQQFPLRLVYLEGFTDFSASYDAANASSVFLANTLLPLVRDVGIDIMSSAFVYLNLF